MQMELSSWVHFIQTLFCFVSIHGGAVFRRFVRRPILLEVWHAARDSFLKLNDTEFFLPVCFFFVFLGIYCLAFKSIENRA